MQTFLSFLGLCWLGVCWVSSTSIASEVLDKEFAFKKVTAFLVDRKTEAVLAPQIERAYQKLFEEEPNFEYSSEGYEAAKAWTEAALVLSLQPPTKKQLQFLSPVLKKLAHEGVDTVFVGELVPSKDGRLDLYTAVVVTAKEEVQNQTVTAIVDPTSLDSINAAVRDQFRELVSELPFRASVIARDGYQIILDRGRDRFAKGMRTALYTVEELDGKPIYQETGVIEVERAESNLTFARIVSERVPYNIHVGNKVLKGKDEIYVWKPSRELSHQEPIEVLKATDAENPDERGWVGYADFNLGPSYLMIVQTDTDGRDLGWTSPFLPGGLFKGELWVTRSLFTETSFKYTTGNATLPDRMTVGMSSTEWSLVTGYRFFFNAPAWGPSVHVKIGYMKRGISSERPSIVPGLTHSGIFLGGGGRFSFTEKLGVQIDLTTLMMRSVSVEPLSTESPESTWAYEIAQKIYYHLNKDLDLSVRFSYQGNGVRYSDKHGIMATTLAAMGGVSYYF